MCAYVVVTGMTRQKMAVITDIAGCDGYDPRKQVGFVAGESGGLLRGRRLDGSGIVALNYYEWPAPTVCCHTRRMSRSCRSNTLSAYRKSYRSPLPLGST